MTLNTNKDEQASSMYPSARSDYASWRDINENKYAHFSLFNRCFLLVICVI